MLCQNCGEKPATVYVTKIINGEKQEIYLCEECARERDDLNFSDPFSFPSLISNLLNKDFTSGFSGIYGNTGQCEVCGLNYERFAKTGKMGCARCYKSFGERLNPLLKRIHGSSEHTGKVPERTGGRMKIKKEIDSLQRQLQAAVAKEEYEKAAVLRDKIRELEKKMQE